MFVPFYTSFPILLYGFTSLRLYSSTALRLYALKPLHFYVSMSLRLYASTPVRLWYFTLPSLIGEAITHKREAEIEPRVKGGMLIFETSSVKQILTQTFPNRTQDKLKG